MIASLSHNAPSRRAAAAAVLTLGARIDGLHGLNERGGLVFDLSYADLDPGLYALGVHRAALHGVLWDAFVACGVPLLMTTVMLPRSRTSDICPGP